LCLIFRQRYSSCLEPPAKFFDRVRGTLYHGYMEQLEVDGINAILSSALWGDNPDPRWIAYALGTTYHETDAQMQPICEYGRGQGHPYGVADPVTGQTYYGRGFVQLTWKNNYETMNTRLHDLGVLKPEDNMVDNAELALRLDVASAVLVDGMMRGEFTGMRLDQFFNAHMTDWLHARRIINGMDRAMIVAGYAKEFWTGLTA
jgi:putative chitinase